MAWARAAWAWPTVSGWVTLADTLRVWSRTMPEYAVFISTSAISSAMVKSPNPLMSMSHGPRLGLTGVLKGLSKSAVAHNVTINTLLPERFDTGRQQQMAQLVMKYRGVTYEEARAEQVASIKAGRLGRPEEGGATCAFLCSVPAAFLSGQNIHLDGGSYGGLV